MDKGLEVPVISSELCDKLYLLHDVVIYLQLRFSPVHCDRVSPQCEGLGNLKLGTVNHGIQRKSCSNLIFFIKFHYNTATSFVGIAGIIIRLAGFCRK